MEEEVKVVEEEMEWSEEEEYEEEQSEIEDFDPFLWNLVLFKFIVTDFLLIYV